MSNCTLLFIQSGVTLFETNDASICSYIVLLGSVDLLSVINRTEVVIGTCREGDTLGEEGVFEVGKLQRRETAVADNDSFVLEMTKEAFNVIQAAMKERSLDLEWFTLMNFMKKQWIQKRSWRMHKDI
jgi:CRP-like cAMP-binding protein